jgi:hypothetical protein
MMKKGYDKNMSHHTGKVKPLKDTGASTRKDTQLKETGRGNAKPLKYKP